MDHNFWIWMARNDLFPVPLASMRSLFLRQLQQQNTPTNWMEREAGITTVWLWTAVPVETCNSVLQLHLQLIFVIVNPGKPQFEVGRCSKVTTRYSSDYNPLCVTCNLSIFFVWTEWDGCSSTSFGSFFEVFNESQLWKFHKLQYESCKMGSLNQGRVFCI